MPKEILEMPIETATMELPDTKTIRLKWHDGHNPEFKTGQFITTYWPDTPAYKRAYSLSSSALDRGFYEVTVKRDGKMGTRIVDWAKVGDKLFVIPPVGKFLPVYEPNKHLVCVAGGVLGASCAYIAQVTLVTAKTVANMESFLRFMRGRLLR